MNLVIGKEPEDEIVEFDQMILMKYLIEFRIESFRRCWNFNEVDSLIKQMPFLEQLSLNRFTQDIRLSNGEEFLAILPKNTLQKFNYCTEYEPNEYLESVDGITASWASTPFPVCCLLAENKNQIFLHTIPYKFSYLDVNSSFVKTINKKERSL
ncbi:hypothetical protein I4U23_027853 [Adineta vaga]|nr:hypothetical protein I4U23_027853 [Adineta vaga]